MLDLFREVARGQLKRWLISLSARALTHKWHLVFAHDITVSPTYTAYRQFEVAPETIRLRNGQPDPLCSRFVDKSCLFSRANKHIRLKIDLARVSIELKFGECVNLCEIKVLCNPQRACSDDTIHWLLSVGGLVCTRISRDYVILESTHHFMKPNWELREKFHASGCKLTHRPRRRVSKWTGQLDTMPPIGYRFARKRD